MCSLCTCTRASVFMHAYVCVHACKCVYARLCVRVRVLREQNTLLDANAHVALIQKTYLNLQATRTCSPPGPLLLLLLALFTVFSLFSNNAASEGDSWRDGAGGDGEGVGDGDALLRKGEEDRLLDCCDNREDFLLGCVCVLLEEESIVGVSTTNEINLDRCYTKKAQQT